MKNGPYTLIVAPDDYPGKKYRGRYCYEHHYVWFRKTGELVPEGFLIHHKNEDKTDNNFENLELMSLSEHTKSHNRERRFADKIHGTLSSYRYCRCELCIDAKRRHTREYKRRKKLLH